MLGLVGSKVRKMIGRIKADLVGWLIGWIDAELVGGLVGRIKADLFDGRPDGSKQIRLVGGQLRIFRKVGNMWE